MNGIDRITEKLESDARAAADAVLAEANEKCTAIQNEYDQKADALLALLMQDNLKVIKAEADREQSSLAMAKKKAMLGVKQELVSQAFAKALERMTTLPKAEYIDFLAGQAASATEDGKGEIILNAKDHAAVGQEVVKAANALVNEKGNTAQLTLSDECRDMAAGLILKCGNIEVNCTAETLLALCRSELAAPVADILFI